MVLQTLEPHCQCAANTLKTTLGKLGYKLRERNPAKINQQIFKHYSFIANSKNKSTINFSPFFDARSTTKCYCDRIKSLVDR